MKNAKYHTLDVKKCCENKLGISFRRGKEFNGWFKLNDTKIARITVPKGRKPIPQKTYRSMASQLKLNVGEFDELLECPTDYEKYVNIIREKI